MIEGEAVVHELVLPVPAEQAGAMVTGRDPAAYPAEQPGERLDALHRQRGKADS